MVFAAKRRAAVRAAKVIVDQKNYNHKEHRYLSYIDDYCNNTEAERQRERSSAKKEDPLRAQPR